MTRLKKINDVAARYQVSTRTLRYYEEIGILWSQRPDPAQPRFYAPDALRRLEQILALRRLQTPLREIRRIFTLQDPTVALGAFVDQLRSLEREEDDLRSRRAMLENLLALFRQKQQAHALEGRDLPEEIVALAQQAVEQHLMKGALTMQPQDLPEVRVVMLEPMRVARYHDPVAPSCFDSWRHMIAWACGHKIKDLPGTRGFGYTSPNPEGIIPKYGYDVLLTIPEGFEPRGHVEAVQFPGGLYAVVTTRYRDYVDHWRGLGRWVEAQDEYERRQGLPLEELRVLDHSVGRESEVDLFYPIQRKGFCRLHVDCM